MIRIYEVIGYDWKLFVCSLHEIREISNFYSACEGRKLCMCIEKQTMVL